MAKLLVSQIVTAGHTCPVLDYLQEMMWRFNNRKNPYLFLDTMVKLLASSNKELTGTQIAA